MGPMTHLGVPDAAQALTGWRLWYAVEVPLLLPAEVFTVGHAGVYRLAGMRGTAEDWPPLEAAFARCVKHKSPHRDSPGEGCRCGFHAIRSLPQFVASFSPAPGVLMGEVWLWGKIIVCERGYKAQFAYPKRLIIPTGWKEAEMVAGELSASYRVATEMGDWDGLVRESGLW